MNNRCLSRLFHSIKGFYNPPRNNTLNPTGQVGVFLLHPLWLKKIVVFFSTEIIVGYVLCESHEFLFFQSSISWYQSASYEPCCKEYVRILSFGLSQALIPLAMWARGHAAGAHAAEPWAVGTGANLFQLTVKAPLALLVCQSVCQRSAAATSSSWARATDGHLEPLTDLMKRNAYLTRWNASHPWALCSSGGMMPVGWSPHLHRTQRFSPSHGMKCIYSIWWIPSLQTMPPAVGGCPDSHRAERPATAFLLSQRVIVWIWWLPYHHPVKRLWNAGKDNLAFLIFRTDAC